MDYESIFTKDKLLQQASNMQKRGFKPGFDSMTADALAIWLTINGDDLVRRLMTLTYEPLPATGFRTAKLKGG